MAGIMGLFDYSKPGKGVDKNAPQKKPFFRFFELFFRKFWKLMGLNVLYLLFCIPIITIGPATAAMCRILKEYVCERPVFLISDFWEHFKKNFKYGVIMELVNVVVIFVLLMSYWFYNAMSEENPLATIPLIVIFALAFIWIVMNYYIFTMIPTIDMKLVPIIKNAFKFAMGIKSNLITFFVTIGLIVAMFFCPLEYLIPIMLLMFFSLYFYIVVFISYPNVEKYIIEPYYEKTGERRPDVYYPPEDFDEDDIIFEDMGREEPVEEAPAEKPVRKKRIIR